MILQLVINNYAIIKHLEVEFSPGLNIITGETGAGKSILIEALETVLGGKVGPELVKSGAAQASVEALFDLEGIGPEKLSGFDLELDGEKQLIIKRKIYPSGKSNCSVNGSLVTQGLLNQLGLLLVDIHGQHAHQRLLYRENHLDFLDEAGELNPLRQNYLKEYKGYQATLKKLERQKELLENDRQTKELIEFQYREIEKSNPVEGEFNELKQERQSLEHSREIQESCCEVLELISHCDLSISHLSSMAGDKLEKAAGLDPDLEILAREFGEISSRVDDVSYRLERYLSGIGTESDRLPEIEERLAELSSLAYKLKCDPDDLPALKKRLEEELEIISSRDRKLKKLSVLEAGQRDKLQETAGKLSTSRRKAAIGMQREIEGELDKIGMDKARFPVDFQEISLSANGTDRVEFHFSANPGEPPRKLVKIASGGELSRIMLAMKSTQANRKSWRSVIFDEVDAGIGGQTALEVGRRLKRIAAGQQVICITHLHHIARFADRHLVVRKQVSHGRTEVALDTADREGQVKELARMLGGGNIDDKVMEHAHSLLS